MLPLLPMSLLLFVSSLVVVLVTAAWFTRRLEAFCELLGLSIGVLSLLGALGANVPNYAASVVAIVEGRTGEGVSIIVGSNIYNIAVILGLCTLASREAAGIALNTQEAQDARGIAWFALPILLSITLVLALLPASATLVGTWTTGPAHMLMLLANLVVLGLFGALLMHLLRRSHPAPASPLVTHSLDHVGRSPWHVMRLSGEVVLGLVIALLGVVVLAAGRTSSSTRSVDRTIGRTSRYATRSHQPAEQFSSCSSGSLRPCRFP